MLVLCAALLQEVLWSCATGWQRYTSVWLYFVDNVLFLPFVIDVHVHGDRVLLLTPHSLP